MLKIETTAIKDVFIIEPHLYADKRGYFFEAFNKFKFERETGIDVCFVQDNQSQGVEKVLRGMHYQSEQVQDKLVRVVEGSIYDVAVDLRKSSKSFGKWVGVELSEKNNKQFFLPKGFAHGFIVLSQKATVIYKTSDYYNPKAEQYLRWNCPIVGIKWPAKDPILNERDAAAPGLDDCETYL